MVKKHRWCQCKNIDFGTYDNSVAMWTPWKYSNGKHKCATVDRCLANEIQSLWNLGIKTLECCCGHQKQRSYIAVYDESVRQMLELGYKQYLKRSDLFYCIGDRDD